MTWSGTPSPRARRADELANADGPEPVEGVRPPLRSHERILEGGGELIAQDRIPLSTHPCLTDGRLQPRRVDLRAFAYATADGYRIATGGLTRFAADPGAMVVNSSQGGGGKDTWVVG